MKMEQTECSETFSFKLQTPVNKLEESIGHVAYLFTLWIRVLLETLTGFQLVKKFPKFYGTRRFITAFTSARHLSVS
jgi:hypothetical protein